MHAVLPLKIKGDYNRYDLTRARMLIYSIEQFWSSTETFNLHVIVRDDELDIVERMLTAAKLSLHFLPETRLLPMLRDFARVSGWYKQQVIKLAAYSIFDANFYLTLDADLVCTKPFDESYFSADGRMLADWEGRDIQRNWWIDSAKILGIAPVLDGDGFKPTPEVFVPEVCQQLQAWLDASFGDGGWPYLLRNLGWTENTLYNMFADQHGLTQRYHWDAGWMRKNRKAVRAWQSFSNEQGFEKWDPVSAFSPESPGLFMVCNSSSKVNPRRIWDKLSPLFPGQPDYSIIDGSVEEN